MVLLQIIGKATICGSLVALNVKNLDLPVMTYFLMVNAEPSTEERIVADIMLRLSLCGCRDICGDVFAKSKTRSGSRCHVS